MPYVDAWRRKKSAAYDLWSNSTARRTVWLSLWGRPHETYANANLSIYSAQPCNAQCPFCVEQLRPASRGRALHLQKTIESDGSRYFAALEQVLVALAPLNPSVSITGGEPSKDPRLPAILRMLMKQGARKRTITTNGSGLWDVQDGRPVIDWITGTGLRHLNISRAHPDDRQNARLMQLHDGLSFEELRAAVARARLGGTRVRLSCLLVKGSMERFDHLLDYVEFARAAGADNVIFRQLMKTDPKTVAPSPVVEYSDAHRVLLEPLLDRLSVDSRFRCVRQIIGYYYYVEVWRYRGMDLVFEEADLGRLEGVRREMPGVIHELVFHPNAQLASTWQPWDGVLGPPETNCMDFAASRYDGEYGTEVMGRR